MSSTEVCRECGHKVRTYKRKLSAEIAVFMVRLCSKYAASRTWIDVKELCRELGLRGGDYAKSKFWSMAFNSVNNDPTKKDSGLWMPTELGWRFATRQVVMPSHALVRGNVVIGFSDRMVTIEQALTQKFNYQQIWSS